MVHRKASVSGTRISSNTAEVHDVFNAGAFHGGFVSLANLPESRREVHVFIHHAANAFPGFHQVHGIGAGKSAGQEICILRGADGGFCAQRLYSALATFFAADNRNGMAFGNQHFGEGPPNIA